MKGKKEVDRQKIEEFFEKNALKCPNGMKILSIVLQQTVEFNLTYLIARYEDANVFYACAQFIAAYYQREYYILPETQRNINKLLSFNFMRDSSLEIYLDMTHHPVGNNKALMEQWSKLLERGCQERKYEFEGECKKWANLHNIGTIPNKELVNCLCVPEGGFRFRDKGNNYEASCNPIVSILTPSTIEDVGCYSEYEKRVIFVNTDGQTYLGKGTHIINLLKSKGFKLFSYYPPLTEDEVIDNKELQKKWEAIKEINDPESP